MAVFTKTKKQSGKTPKKQLQGSVKKTKSKERSEVNRKIALQVTKQLTNG